MCIHTDDSKMMKYKTMKHLNKYINEIKSKLDFNDNELTIDDQLEMYCVDLETLEHYELNVNDDEWDYIQTMIRIK